MNKKVKELLELFVKYQRSDIPFSQDEYIEFGEAAWALEKVDVVYKPTSKLQLTRRGIDHLEGLIAFEGDLQDYDFDKPLKVHK